MHIAHKLLISGIAVAILTMFGAAILAAGSMTAPVVVKSRGNVMVALGDSLTAASNACGKHNACKTDSWSTGDNPRVNSLATRIQKDTGKKLTVYNYAHIGDKVGALDDQLDKTIKLRPGIITILLGSNDFCTNSVNTMSSTTGFRSTFQASMAKLRAALPETKVVVSSTINPNALWQNLRHNAAATTAWSKGLCGAMLANATSTSASAQQQRQAVITRAHQFNSILGATCKQYGARCKYTSAVTKFAYTTQTVSTVDYLHPNVTGQAKLASLVFNSGGMRAFLTR